MLSRFAFFLKKKVEFDEQTGFRMNHSTIVHIFIISQIIEKTIVEYNMNIYILFIDFEKAFDFIDLSYLWKAFKRLRIHQGYVNILVEMYSGTSAQIRMDKKGSRFAITNGVKQGYPLLPNLFNCIIEKIFWKM